MSRIHTSAVESANGAAAEVHAQIKKAVGGIPNMFAAIVAHGSNALKAILQADGALVRWLAVTVFTNVFNRINDTMLDFPAV